MENGREKAEELRDRLYREIGQLKIELDWLTAIGRAAPGAPFVPITSCHLYLYQADM